MVKRTEPAPEAATPAVPARRGPSLGLVMLLVLVLLWTTALSLVAFHPTARLRAVTLVDRVLGRDAAVGGGEDAPDPEAETPEMRLARIEAELSAERARLEQWEQALGQREATVAAHEAQLVLDRADLELATSQLLATGADLARLSRLCRQMKPRDAAALLEGMPNDQILLVLKGIADADAAKIIAAMTPARAAELMRLMAPGETAHSST